jgi:hypothetical protein
MEKEKLQQKLIDFEGGQILGVRDETGALWLGVRKVCNDLGLTEGQTNRQVNNISDDLVFEGNYTKFDMVQNEGRRQVNREVLCIKEDVITLWLAKIKLTPIMQKENPEAVKKLIKYQLKCAKVLHNAFFSTEEQKQETFNELGLEGKIVNLESKIDAQTGELKETKDRLNTLIDNSTINSRQASRLLTHAKDRVSTMLGGAHSAEYKKNSRTYFKNLWLQLCQEFEVTTYKDLNPLNYASAVTFVSNWSFN